MEPVTQQKPLGARVTVTPGVCGFPCVIESLNEEKRSVSLSIQGSDCKHIQRLSELLTSLSLRDIFTPVTKNPVFEAAQRAGCHASCPVPLAALKAAEVAMEMALPRDVTIQFDR